MSSWWRHDASISDAKFHIFIKMKQIPIYIFFVDEYVFSIEKLETAQSKYKAYFNEIVWFHSALGMFPSSMQ